MPSDSEPKLLFSQSDKGQNVKVWQQDNHRWLEFGDELIQTEIVVDRPDYLPESFSRAMLAGVMFSDAPKRVLLAGTGGGSTARYFASRFPAVAGEAVELSEMIIEIAKNHFDCPHTDNWSLVSADIKDYVQQCDQRYDLIVMDIAIDQQTPTWIVEQSFLQHCRQLLTQQGHLSLNLIVTDGESFLHFLAAIRKVFDGQTVCLTLTEHQNILIYAYNQLPEFNHQQLIQRLPQLESDWQVEFNTFYQQMLKDNPKGSGVL